MQEGLSARLCWTSRMELDPRRRKEWVNPPGMVLMLTLSGTGTLVVRDGGEYPVDSGEHSLFLLTPATRRYVISNPADPLTVFALGISVEFADGSDFFDCCRAEKLEFTPGLRERIAAAVSRLYRIRRASDRRAAVERQCLTLQICSAATELCAPRPEAELPRAVDRCRKAVEHIFSHYREEVNMEALAGMCGMSRTGFFRAFRSETGVTPGEFRLRLRIREAQKLLLQNRLSVAEIAAALGWESPFFFSRIFRRETGFSPREFRNGRINL